jgi:general secretion pathway protein K
MSEHSPSRERGAILVIVLWAIAMMTVVIAALGTNVRTSTGLAVSETRRLKTEMLLEGGIDIAAAALIASGDQILRLSDGHSAQVDLGRGNIMTMAIRDAGGLIDINRAEDAVMAGLIAHVTGSSETGKTMAQQIAQARSAAAGAADDSQPPAFITAKQLYNIGGIDPKAVAAILPFVGIYSKEGHINLAAAPDEVIASIPGITPLQIDTIAAARSRGDWQSQDIKDIAGDFEDYVSLDSTNVFLVDVTLGQSAELIAGTHLRATVMVDANGEKPFHVLSRSW